MCLGLVRRDMQSGRDDQESRRVFQNMLNNRSRRSIAPMVNRSTNVKRCQRISSFGRRETKDGARFYGTLKGFYRAPMKILLSHGKKYCPYPHTMVNVIFNDPDLIKYRQIFAETGEYPSTDHIDPSDDKKSENHYKSLRWGTVATQCTNRNYTAKGKASYAAAMSTSRIQYREAGAEWADANICVGQSAVAKITGHAQSAISKFLDDGKTHGFIRTKRRPIAPIQRFEYRSRPFEVIPGFENEVWYELPAFPGYGFSDMGRYWPPKRAPTKGTKYKSDFYRYVKINGVHYKVHDLIGRVIFGMPPSAKHTINHGNHDLDEDGCYSNSRSNLRGWASSSEQNHTKGICSLAESIGKPVHVTCFSTDERYEYTDITSAALAWGNTHRHMSKLAGKRAQQDDDILFEFSPQPDLIRVNTTIVGGQVKLELEVERWVDINPTDFEEGGKYHLLYVNAKTRGLKCQKRSI